MYSFEDFKKNITITTYNLWEDFGYKKTALLLIDDKAASFHINPNNDTIYKDIKDGKKPEGDFFVLGSKEYYELINLKINKQYDREKWYELTNDLAYNIDLLNKYYYDTNSRKGDKGPTDIIKTSFMRFKNYTEIKYQLNRMTLGGKYLDNFKLIIYDKKNKTEILNIDVDPDVDIPENTFGLIGKNGTGKTYLLNNLAKLFLNEESIFNVVSNENDSLFLNKVLHVSYSPFDTLEISEKNDSLYEKIGLLIRENNMQDKSISEFLNKDLNRYIKDMNVPTNIFYKDFWLEVLNNFSYEDWINDFISEIDKVDFMNKEVDLVHIISRLSSGQKIIMLTITKLILKVREKTLVLIDEPELFLHPSLAKSYIRAIIQIITRMNGICVVATHNPLILQELQTKCVKITTKQKDSFEIKNLADFNINSYGESVTVLNNTVFGIDIQNTGYYQYLTSLGIKKLKLDKKILQSKLGSEGRVLLKHLLGE